jgi:hypothetical protein
METFYPNLLYMFLQYLECTLNLSANQPCVSISWANNFAKFTFFALYYISRGKKVY